MEAYTITAFCPIHNTGSDGGTRTTGTGDLIVSSLMSCPFAQSTETDTASWIEGQVFQDKFKYEV